MAFRSFGWGKAVQRKIIETGVGGTEGDKLIEVVRKHAGMAPIFRRRIA